MRFNIPHSEAVTRRYPEVHVTAWLRISRRALRIRPTEGNMNIPFVANSIELREVSELVPYARNARVHSENQIKQIAASIKEFGFIVPVVVDRDSGVVAGHGRLLAAERLGIQKAPCISVDHLTENQKRAFILADNKLTELGGWNDEWLRVE